MLFQQQKNKQTGLVKITQRCQQTSFAFTIGWTTSKVLENSETFSMLVSALRSIFFASLGATKTHPLLRIQHQRHSRHFRLQTCSHFQLQSVANKISDNTRSDPFPHALRLIKKGNSTCKFFTLQTQTSVFLLNQDATCRQENIHVIKRFLD